MAHDEASAGLLNFVTDTHLAERARLGDAVSFDALVRRHAEVVGSFATVVTGESELAGPVTARAFTDVLDQIGSGGYSIEEPFLPGLLRSTREVARIRAESDAVRPGAFAPTGTEDSGAGTQAAVWGLDEPARSERWLTGVLGLGALDVATVLDLSGPAVASLAQASADQLGSEVTAAYALLASIEADLPPWTAEDARTTWQTWIATVPGAPARVRAPFAARFEPVAARILRGAAVVLLVAGGAGIVFGNPGSPSTRMPSAGAEQAAGGPGGSSAGTVGGDSSGPAPGGDGVDDVVGAVATAEPMSAGVSEMVRTGTSTTDRTEHGSAPDTGTSSVPPSTADGGSSAPFDGSPPPWTGSGPPTTWQPAATGDPSASVATTGPSEETAGAPHPRTGDGAGSSPSGTQAEGTFGREASTPARAPARFSAPAPAAPPATTAPPTTTAPPPTAAPTTTAPPTTAAPATTAPPTTAPTTTAPTTTAPPVTLPPVPVTAPALESVPSEPTTPVDVVADTVTGVVDTATTPATDLLGG